MIPDDFAWIPPLRPPRKPRKVTVQAPCKYDHRKLYYDARRVMYERELPVVYADGGYYDSPFPKVNTSNGLTMAIINYLNWTGWNADRTGTQGRMIKDKAGNYKRIPSANRKGTSDVSATIKGRSVKLEIKIGRDKPSEEQLREQIRERNAGGVYEFIHNFDEFFDWYFKFMQSI